MKTKRPDDQYSEQEARRRFEEALRAGFKTPAKPHSEMKLGKSPQHKTIADKEGAKEKKAIK